MRELLWEMKLIGLLWFLNLTPQIKTKHNIVIKRFIVDQFTNHIVVEFHLHHACRMVT